LKNQNFGNFGGQDDLLNETSQQMPVLQAIGDDKEQLLQNTLKKRPKTTKSRGVKKAFRRLPPNAYINPVPNDKTLVLDIDEELLMSHHGFHLKLFMDKQVSQMHKKRGLGFVTQQSSGWKE
jgi:hypothetical protein